jgi:hypothetical protein
MHTNIHFSLKHWYLTYYHRLQLLTCFITNGSRHLQIDLRILVSIRQFSYRYDNSAHRYDNSSYGYDKSSYRYDKSSYRYDNSSYRYDIWYIFLLISRMLVISSWSFTKLILWLVQTVITLKFMVRVSLCIDCTSQDIFNSYYSQVTLAPMDSNLSLFYISGNLTLIPLVHNAPPLFLDRSTSYLLKMCLLTETVMGTWWIRIVSRANSCIDWLHGMLSPGRWCWTCFQALGRPWRFAFGRGGGVFRWTLTKHKWSRQNCVVLLC